MKSTRSTIEQVKKLANFHQALIDLAEDHANLEALDNATLAAEQRKKTVFEELDKANAFLEQAKRNITSAEEKAALVARAADNTKEQARLQGQNLIDEARIEAGKIIEAAKSEAAVLKAPAEGELGTINKTISSRKDLLAKIEKGIDEKTAIHDDLQAKIAEAENHINNLFKTVKK